MQCISRVSSKFHSLLLLRSPPRILTHLTHHQCRMSSKKLLNSVERCVDDNLEGVVAINPGIRLIDNTRVVVRADIEDVKKSGKVTLLCGGGSGHEPAFAGYVGPGMLSAAVAGSVFTSPPPRDILAGLRMIAKDNPAGALVIVINYTGDRINFGLAVERAKAEGLSCDMVVVGEDCALASHDRTAGRRGLCGVTFVNKIAGALANEGKSLKEVAQQAKLAADNMGTIGLALGSCSTPGSTGPLFTVKDDEMELGLGLHGEAGVKTVKLLSAKDTVKLMINHMTNPQNSTHLSVSKGDRVACMINNLGSMSIIEMNVIAKETIEYLESDLGLQVDRAYCGEYVTSLEMAGVSISLLKLNDMFKKCLDASAVAPAWIVPLLAPGQTDRQTPKRMPQVEVTSTAAARKGIDISAAEAEKVYDILQRVCERLVGAKDHLDGLDSESGDGDCGSTIARGALHIKEKLGSKSSPGLSVNNPAQLSLELAGIVETVMGGSSGGIYSLFFTAASVALQKDVSGKTWLQAMSDGIAAIQRYGGAQPGDRTMLDALWAANKTFESELSKSSPTEAFKAAVSASEVAAESTKDMKAHAGRASYVSAERLKKPDPGAVAVTVWLKAVLEILQS